MIQEYKKPKFDIQKFVVILLIVLIVWLISSIFFDKVTGEEKLFTVEVGESVDSIADRLKDEGLIESGLTFKTYLQVTDQGGLIKAGDHYLALGMSLAEIVKELIIATSQSDVQITLIEGWHNQEIAEYLNEEIGMKVNDFLSAANNEYSQYDWLPNLNIQDYTQGYLFPDTYRIIPEASPQYIVEKLLQTFDDKVYQTYKSDIAKHSMTLHEILTLASIVEMEVKSETDRKLVSDLFLRRLADNYPLQSDATVNYMTKSGRAQSTYKDLEIDSPYNTYKYAGLPPGPIGNPGLSSIKAVLNPMPNSYYFFLTTKDDGRVIYSRTHDEHLQNKAKYLD